MILEKQLNNLQAQAGSPLDKVPPQYKRKFNTQQSTDKLNRESIDAIP